MISIKTFFIEIIFCIIMMCFIYLHLQSNFMWVKNNYTLTGWNKHDLLVYLNTSSERDRSKPFTCLNVAKDFIKSSVVIAENGKWQIMYLPKAKQKIFIHAAYYDDRLPGKESIISFILSENLMNLSTPVKCLVWNHIRKTPLRLNGYLQKIEISKYTMGNIHYVPVMVKCVAKQLISRNELPNYVSLVFESCNNLSFNNSYVPLVYDNVALSSNQLPLFRNKRIGVCLGAQYGNMNDKEAFFFVQWMEALLIFGVNEVTMYNASLNFRGKLASKVLKYYTGKNQLFIHQFQPPMTYKIGTREALVAAEIIRMHAVNHCLHANRKKYWYILHIDRDEIPIPISAPTYQEVIKSHLAQHKQDPEDDSIPMYSALFYTYFAPGNKSAPNTMPLMKFTNRLPTEPVARSGIIKSFINPRLCSSVWSHKCLVRTDNKWIPPQIMDQTDAIVYHYRKSCRIIDRCKTEWDKHFEDVWLLNKYGKLLERRTLLVLDSVMR